MPSTLPRAAAKLATADDLLTLRETAAELRCSAHLVLRLIAAGELKSKRVGREHRIRRAWLDAYLERVKR